MYSVERRFERYRIMHVWKMLEGLVPNLTVNPITSIIQSKRTGRRCNIDTVPVSAIGTMKHTSFSNHGARLFNSLPKHVRNLTSCSLNVFKSSLDKVLTVIPDEPILPGNTHLRRADTNSIVNMIRVDGRRLMLQAGHLDA